MTLVASFLLHGGALLWWLNRPVEQPLQLGMAQAVTEQVTVTLIAPPTPAQAQQPAPPAIQSEPPVPDEGMAVVRKVVKKRTPTPQPTPPVAVPLDSLPSPAAGPVAETRAPATVSAARYDADYLNNPAPGYPPMSRRLGEQGTALLRVQVSGDGKPLVVELKQSSGFERLDTAARVAAEKWRFVPARQGDAVLASWVEVPIQFSLQKAGK
jgi:protein TonB